MNILREAAGLQPLLMSTMTKEAEPPMADFERREPRCRICRDENVRVLVNKLLDWHGAPIILARGKAHTVTYADILRDLEPLNKGRDKKDRITYDSLWVEATKDGSCVLSDHGDFYLVDCRADLTLWYFTKPNHPAHPGVIRRQLVQEVGGGWNDHVQGYSFGTDDDQPVFQAWLAQIQDLDRQAKEYFDKKQALKPTQNPN